MNEIVPAGPIAFALPRLIAPAVSIVPPVYELLPVSVSVPDPSFVSEPEPLMTTDELEVPERLKTSAPLFVRLNSSVPLYTRLLASHPVVPPVPIWRVPPGCRFMVPYLPCDSVPPTDTSPPVIVSVPVPRGWPTLRLPLLAHVPLETVAVPRLPLIPPR